MMLWTIYGQVAERRGGLLMVFSDVVFQLLQQFMYRKPLYEGIPSIAKKGNRGCHIDHVN